ncbi:kinase-like protein [Lophium mytilinum]|uniref:Kinase-like protein n=1 Tax=Lophium mytilinum TaxID=390894 RepID=A0A6A6RB67_9PEZI|nr:kinase-like protein [Lophium mytilinum]
MATHSPSLRRPAELLDQHFVSEDPESQWKSRTSYTDTDIQDISSLLDHVKPTWSKFPRAYVVLRAISKLDQLDPLIASGFTDHCFPVTETRTLPPQLPPTTRAEILSAQGMILTKSMDIEKGERGRHMHFGPGELIPFESKEVLGLGRYGEVDRVISLISHKEYARKQISRRLAFGDKWKREAVAAFAREVSILSSLHHRNIVQFNGSYTDTSSYCLLLSPVAEMSLSCCLRNPVDASSPTSLTANVTPWMGQLSSALSYLHGKRIRHADIKPDNLIIKQRDIFLADFGISRAYSYGESSTSSGPTNHTARYCAPEITLQERRHYSSDIWSLGCVFFEMAAAKKSWTTQNLEAFFGQTGTCEPYIRQNLPALKAMLVRLRMGSPFSWSLHWAEEMLKLDPRSRPTAAQIAAAAVDHVKEGYPPSEGLVEQMEVDQLGGRTQATIVLEDMYDGPKSSSH